jgi:peroxiredoxin
MTRTRIYTAAVVAGALALRHNLPAGAQTPPDVIRVTLSRNDDHVAAVVNGLTFEKDRVAQAMAATPVTLPDPLPPGSVVGFNTADKLFVIAARTEGSDGATLTVDANANGDLRDDGPVHVPRRTKAGDGTIIKIKRIYPGPPPSETWLPYRFQYTPQVDKKGGGEQVGFMVSAAYRMEGSFVFEGTEYLVELNDYDQRGRFDKSNLSRGTVLRIHRKGAPDDERPYLWGYELIAIGEEFYEVAGGALDGSSLELKRNTLPHAAIGRAAPDIRLTDTEGATFALSDYRGRYLLLDFWPSWCGPCIAQFPTIKKTAAQYERDLAVIGINLDEPNALATARKIVSEKDLTWRHVMEGRGYFLPIYQILGRLPEHRMSFPLYVAIAPDGIIRYATNDFGKMQLFLDAALAPEARRRDSLFVPLSTSNRSRMASPLPVDFDGPALEALLKKPGVKLPADLPKDARVGRLPNDTLVAARVSDGGGRWILRVDADRDFDLTNDQDKELPVLDAFPAKPEETPTFPLTLTYTSGSRTFRPFRFFARRKAAPSTDPPDIFFIGWEMASSGSFVSGKVEYQIVMNDPTNDLVWSSADLKSSAAFTLREMRDGKWVAVHAGASGIPIGGRTYHVAHVHDDGQMVKLQVEGAAGRR